MTQKSMYHRFGVCNVEQARIALGRTSESTELSVYSLLCDLMFYCDEYKIDFEAAKERAETFFQRQTKDDGE